MSHDLPPRRRNSLRLQGYDYAQEGMYFATICVAGRECLLGRVTHGVMMLNEYGNAVQLCLQETERYFDHVLLDEWIVMPNHMHILVELKQLVTSSPRRTLGQVIAYFKYQSTRQINLLRNTPTAAVWQRGYHDRVIRTETELAYVQQYIVNNPMQWAQDKLFNHNV